MTPYFHRCCFFMNCIKASNLTAKYKNLRVLQILFPKKVGQKIIFLILIFLIVFFMFKNITIIRNQKEKHQFILYLGVASINHMWMEFWTFLAPPPPTYIPYQFLTI